MDGTTLELLEPIIEEHPEEILAMHNRWRIPKDLPSTINRKRKQERLIRSRLEKNVSERGGLHKAPIWIPKKEIDGKYGTNGTMQLDLIRIIQSY